MKTLRSITGLVMMAGLLIAGCGTTSTSSPSPAAATSPDVLCTQGGLGTWNATYSTCTCQTGYTYDSISKTCLMSSTTTPLATTPLATTPTTGQCAVGQVMISGVCQTVANITEQQGCQATGGLWNVSICQCPSGLTWQAAWKSCQSFSTGTGVAQQLCIASGGTASVVAGQCQCPYNMTVQTQSPYGYQYCVASSLLGGLTNPSSTQALGNIVLAVQQLLQALFQR